MVNKSKGGYRLRPSSSAHRSNLALHGSGSCELNACILRHQLQKEPISSQGLLVRIPEVRVTRRPPSVEQRRRILFRQRRQDIAKSFLAELDGKMTDGQISKLTASAGGIKIVWSRRLRTTAGRAMWRGKIRKHTQSSQRQYYNDATIELAEKIVNDENRLYNVMAHEFCHLANIMISNVTTKPHGRSFKEWGDKCSKIFENLEVNVKTTHSYT